MGKHIGILGGSFDPIHMGHLMMAQDALEHMKLDKILFMPTAQSPLKENAPLAADQHRLRMVELATEGHPRFDVSDYEIERGGKSYTIETVKYLKKAYFGAKLYWIIANDVFSQLDLWKDIDRLHKQIDFIVVRRNESSLESSARENLHFIGNHLYEISSTEIRKRLQENQFIHYFVPERVQAYIKKHHLYGTTTFRVI